MTGKATRSADDVYGINVARQQELQRQKPFTTDPKYFRNVRIGPSATMKMMQHVQSGVEKGIKRR
jgi:COP9 signalosome complex subunit 5